jgi:hypothetical protein
MGMIGRMIPDDAPTGQQKDQIGQILSAFQAKMPLSVSYIERDERPALHAFQYSRHSDNPHCMNLLLDFVEIEFELLPVESPGESITFIPPFVALVGAALWDTSIWVSLYG